MDRKGAPDSIFWEQRISCHGACGARWTQGRGEDGTGPPLGVAVWDKWQELVNGFFWAWEMLAYHFLTIY